MPDLNSENGNATIRTEFNPKAFLLQCGSMLHAQLEIWKAAVEESPRNTLAASWSPAGVVQTPNSNTAGSPAIGKAPVSVKGSSCSVDFSDGKWIFKYHLHFINCF